MKNNFIRMAENIKRTLAEFLLLFMFTISAAICFVSLSISFEIYKIHLIIIVKLVFLLLMLMFNLFLFSLLGTRLMEANFRISYKISQLNFANMNKISLRKYLIIILIMSQKKIGIKIGKFCYVTLETYREIVNTMISYFSVLRELLINSRNANNNY